MRIFLIVITLALFAGKPQAFANEMPPVSHAVILAYFQIGDALDPASSVSSETFARHMDILAREGYSVLSLPEAHAYISAGKMLPDKTVVLTFENADVNSLRQAAPILRQYGFPYAVFFTPGAFDETNSWSYIRQLARNENVTLGIHSYTYQLYKDVAEFRAQINRGQGRFEEELGARANYFSFPFGLYTEEMLVALRPYGFKAMMGQHSGVMQQQSDMMLPWPRFTMTQDYADEERFRKVTSALPLAAHDITPLETLISASAPAIGFTLMHSNDMKDLVCFSSEEGRLKLLKMSNVRVEIRPAKLSRGSRLRINCTTSSEIDFEQRWQWLGFLFER